MRLLAGNLGGPSDLDAKTVSPLMDDDGYYIAVIPTGGNQYVTQFAVVDGKLYGVTHEPLDYPEAAANLLRSHGITIQRIWPK